MEDRMEIIIQANAFSIWANVYGPCRYREENDE